MKFVENQAQSVGKNMKRFYSDVIHDILPPLKHEGQGVALKKSATIDVYVKSKAAIEEDHIDTIGKLAHVEPVAVDPIEKQLDHASNDLCLSDQLSTPISVDAHEGAESHIISGQVSDDLKNTVNIEENFIMEKKSASEVLELISPSKEEPLGASLGNEVIDCSDKNSCGVVGEVSLTLSVHDLEFQSSQREGTVNNNVAVDVVNKQLDCAFSELCLVDQLGNPNSAESLLRTEYVTSERVAEVLKDTNPEVNREENDTLEKPSVSEVSELISPAEKESCGASLLSKLTDCNDKEPCWVEAEVSPSTSVHDVTKPSASDVLELISPVEEESFGASMGHEFVNCNGKNSCVVLAEVSPATLVCGGQDARIVKNDFADDSEFVSDASGGITSSKVTWSEKNMAEVGVDSSCGSVLKELHENSPVNFLAEALVNHDPVDVAGLVSHNVPSSSMLTPLLSNEKKLMGAVSISSSNDLSMESLENDGSRTVNGIKYLTGISGNKNVYFGGESTQLQALDSSDIGPINDSTDDVIISSMETIELSDEVKLEDSCVIIDSTALYAVSRIMRKHRSYKKRIQDALTSKTRLAKEYEQLAIWFGDADMGSNQDFLQTQRPSSSTTPSECKSLQTELVCDSEWELL
ncbi:Fiber Fb32-like protein isoform 3 [Theobroma cacao]|uniref:Fiber Fb32-like protein isoform 3 n=1 Tax=Theobroma cacao TaxID=3641 RepID=A0A061FFH6_THECC|nr:Fiber Fb32-like protein isoform 3 [Theobroma cacao]